MKIKLSQKDIKNSLDGRDFIEEKLLDSRNYQRDVIW